jgi:hypothetical protein
MLAQRRLQLSAGMLVTVPNPEPASAERIQYAINFALVRPCTLITYIYTLMYTLMYTLIYTLYIYTTTAGWGQERGHNGRGGYALHALQDPAAD